MIAPQYLPDFCVLLAQLSRSVSFHGLEHFLIKKVLGLLWAHRALDHHGGDGFHKGMSAIAPTGLLVLNVHHALVSTLVGMMWYLFWIVRLKLYFFGSGAGLRLEILPNMCRTSRALLKSAEEQRANIQNVPAKSDPENFESWPSGHRRLELPSLSLQRAPLVGVLGGRLNKD